MARFRVCLAYVFAARRTLGQLLKPALRLMSFYRLRIMEIKDAKVCGEERQDARLEPSLGGFRFGRGEQGREFPVLIGFEGIDFRFAVHD